MGRLTRDPEIRYSQGDNQMAVARYTLAIDRPVSRNREGADNQPQADFPNVVAFGRNADFAEKYLHKGTKIMVEGQIRTGSYTRQDGTRVYTTEVVVDRHEFCESRGNDSSASYSAPSPMGGAPEGQAPDTGFMNIPDGIDEELPFG